VNHASSARCWAEATILSIRPAVGGSIRSVKHIGQQLRPDPVGPQLGVRDTLGQPHGQLLGVDRAAHPEPQMVPDLPPVILDRSAGPLVQPELRRWDLHLAIRQPVLRSVAQQYYSR
jgi:hypothetical protein